jgi:EAL domain-containing protein (putative c-di-GMP-specific phosphodiesterase class I)/GGDEF domain-containing protein
MERLVLTDHDYSAIAEKIRTFHRYNPLLHQYKIRFGEKHILEEIEKFIRTLEIDTAKARSTAGRISALFIEHSIPFAILIEDLEIIKDYLITNICPKERESDEVTEFFKALKNHVGYFFLKHEVREIKMVEIGYFSEKVLYNIHKKWERWLIDSIMNETMEDFPLMDSEACPFIFSLEYPESKMICHELNICDYLKSTHAKLHELAITFAYLFIRHHYKSAYIVFQQIKEFNEKLLNLISILYFNAQINRPQTFKNYLYSQTFEQKELFIAIFDIHSMKEINKFYAPKIADRVIELVEETLKSVYLENQGCMVYTRGTGGDFYILFENCSIDTIRGIEEHFDETLNQKRAASPMLPGFVVKKAFLKLQEPRIFEKDEIAVMFSYLKESLKGEEKSRYMTDMGEQEKMREWISSHFAYMHKLKRALDEGKIEIFLQPVSYMERIDKIHAYEVLVRIEEEGRYIPAGAFIDLIIRMKMISQLDHLVLERILHYQKEIHRITGKLFINVSASTLQDEGYIGKLIDAIRGPMFGTEIIVELTEQELLENLGRIIQLHRDYGLIFAIDDFGTGYSSLQTVIKLAEEGAVRYLKLDGSLTKSFENSESTQRIIRIVSKMSRSLRLETIIEFVETENQRYELLSYDIDYAQGYYIGRPRSIADLTGSVEEKRL